MEKLSREIINKKTVRELGGEIWAEITMESDFVTDSSMKLIPNETKNELIDLITGVLARHVGVVIENDEDFPVTPKEKIFPDEK